MTLIRTVIVAAALLAAPLAGLTFADAHKPAGKCCTCDSCKCDKCSTCAECKCEKCTCCTTKKS